ncbi:MAG: response regulator [Acidobacteria bacterium]|nr:response regulator [Acidobacteriota bacterium]
MTEKFLTTEEVLRYLNVNLRTVYRWLKAGRLPAIRVGRQWRFRQSDLDAWLEGQRSAHPAGSPQAPAPRAARRRVLVVDGEPAVRKLLDASLSLAEYEVKTLSDGRTALDRLQHEHYDLLITALATPGLDGLGLVRKVRRILPSLPIVIVTGHSSEPAAVEALNLGVRGYLRKPVHVSRLLEMVKRALGDES